MSSCHRGLSLHTKKDFNNDKSREQYRSEVLKWEKANTERKELTEKLQRQQEWEDKGRCWICGGTIGIFRFGKKLCKEHMHLQLPLSSRESLEKLPLLTLKPFPPVFLVQIPGGSFLMGSNDGGSDEKPVHRVTVQPFKMQSTEVTQAQWEAVMGGNPSEWRGDNLPVEQVSWDDCQEFLSKLNQLDPGKGYRLPSEAEWEYACRAGTMTKYNTGDSESDLARAGWYHKNSYLKTHPVGQKVANKWGLYDMHGNVWEWCQDDLHENYHNDFGCRKAPTDGTAWVDKPRAGLRILRGGSRDSSDFNCRSATRGGSSPGSWGITGGFRLVCR